MTEKSPYRWPAPLVCTACGAMLRVELVNGELAAFACRNEGCGAYWWPSGDPARSSRAPARVPTPNDQEVTDPPKTEAKTYYMRGED